MKKQRKTKGAGTRTLYSVLIQEAHQSSEEKKLMKNERATYTFPKAVLTKKRIVKKTTAEICPTGNYKQRGEIRLDWSTQTSAGDSPGKPIHPSKSDEKKRKRRETTKAVPCDRRHGGCTP